MPSETGTSLIYTLKVTYFNQVEEFNKLVDYLTGYSGEDASVVPGEGNAYAVTTHVDAASLVFDPFTAIATIGNLTNVKVTVGEEVTNSTDATVLKEFLTSKIPFSHLLPQVAAAIEITAGGEVATYTLTYGSDYVADPEAVINTTRYQTLTEALAAAVSGDTVVLQKDLAVNNASAAAADHPVIVVPNGVTFDGNNKTVTADNDTWVGTDANHIIGISGTTGTIKNLTVVGNGKNKSGVVVYGLASSPASAVLENVTSKNNPNAGIIVAGAAVTATNVNTSDNVWGGINVDKASNGTVPSFTFNSGTLAEKAEIYTEVTDQDVITAPSMTKYQGFGSNLKGFIYYTSDVSRLGTIMSDDNTKVYETLGDAASNNASVKLTAGLTGVCSIPVGTSLTVDGQGNTINGQIKCEAVGSGNSNVTLKNLTLDGAGSGTTYGIISQNQTDNDQMECNLTLENVTIKGFTSKGIYATNLKTLNITGGTIENCATGPMDDPNTRGDYALDLNLVAVKNTVVNIDGVTFTGDLGEKAAIKITARGGASDAGASDIPKNVGEASIDMVTINNCVFTGSTTEVDYRIGTDHKTPGSDALLNTTGAYAVSLVGNTEMVVQSAYLTDEPKLTVPAGRTASKTSSTDIAIDLTPEEELDNIMDSIPGAVEQPGEEGSNVYTLTTTDGTIDMSFLDQISVIDELTTIVVTDGTTTYTFTDGTDDIGAFKTQVQGLLPDSNDDATVNLTITVNLA